ncbi:glycosyl hydrolase family 8 [Actinoplanes sp. ATCC 53533]|uniref:glycosyl hydrolase family 8 n=1 Tax=Actinoplanes sp. ATCC 53533 TaxID=1288362 RepID=UPI001F2BA0D3|nr:glycosyl hydrolase family 8 [Actinoplanes sp. ATCC 53533]
MPTPTRKTVLTVAAITVVALLAVGYAWMTPSPQPSTQAPPGSHRFAAIRPSAPQQDQNAAVLRYYRSWKTAFVRQACTPGMYQIYSPDAAYPYIAEAQGYGLVITASIAELDPEAKTIFDGLLAYVLSHPSRINSDLAAAEQDETCTDRGGGNSATDGDMDIAYGLLLADRLWGSADRYNYRELAVRRIQALKASVVNPGSKLMQLGDWVTPADRPLFDISRTSDWNLQYFRAFETATGDPGWSTIRAAHQQAITRLQTTYSPATGLLPDFVRWTGNGVQPVRGKVLETSHDGDYHFNACRTPWRIGLDAVTSGSPASLQATQKINAWFKKVTGGDPTKVRSGYRLNGTAYGDGNDNAFWAPLAVAAMTDPASQQWLDALWTRLAAAPGDPQEYFGVSVQLQVMLAVSGNVPAL